MSVNKKNKISRWELERERLSNFVVDLRTKKEEGKKEEKKEKKNIIIKKKIAKLKGQIREIKPNLLKREFLPDKKYFFWPKIKLTKSRFKTKIWRKAITEKQKILNRPAKVRANKQRIKQAERKVTWYRSLFSFAIVLILIIVPLKILSYFQFLDIKSLEEKIMSRSQSALSNLMAATDSVNKMDFKTADVQFQNASQNFLAAQDELDRINDSILALAAISSDPKIKLAAESKKFLTAGALVSSLGHNLVSATDSLFNSQAGEFSAALNSFAYFGNLAVADAKDLEKEIKRIDPNNLPVEYQVKFESLQNKTNLLVDSLENFVDMGVKLKEVLGLSKDKRYLLVFQNNAELRASGGFLGSYALVDLREGQIRNLEVPGGGSYDTEAGMSVLVKAPEPLWLVNPLWHFWDANWWPDWPTTAENLMWFYEKSNGPTVDGVISITPTVVERLLEVTGPIDLMTEYGLVIDANNFWETVQKVVEDKNLAKFKPEAMVDFKKDSEPIESTIPLEQGLEVNTANKPKKIIGDLMAKILEVLPQKLDKDSLIKIISLFEQSLSEKQILFYFTDSNLQAEIADRNWAGEIRHSNRDYLMVVNTNIAGQKSDKKMIEKIEHQSEVTVNGDIINTVRITKTHTGVKREPLFGVRNVNWLRIYVPLGSQLLQADGFLAPDPEYLTEKPEADWEDNHRLANELKAKIHSGSNTKIYQENDKTVFANWVMVDPGETIDIIIKYRLPFNFFEQTNKENWLNRINEFLNPNEIDLLSYSLLAQKQPGAKPSQFSSQLTLPSSLTVFWRHPDDLVGEQGWEISDQLNSDRYWSILVNKK